MLLVGAKKYFGVLNVRSRKLECERFPHTDTDWANPFS